MQQQELEERIAAYSPWLYRFEFEGGVTTPLAYPHGQTNRHEQRRRYFFDALLALTGGSLRGHRVLDLGCNAGFWSLAAIEAQADFVLGVDAREMYLDQAKLVFEAKGIEPQRYRFELANFFELELQESFDLVLCLGFMDVTCRPVELFERMTRAGAETIVIDTSISRAPSSFFEMSRLNDRRNAIDHELVLLPSRGAVGELAGDFGYRSVALAHEMSDYTGLDDYRNQRRLAFICSKTGGLDGLIEAKPPPLESWLLARADPRVLWRRLRG